MSVASRSITIMPAWVATLDDILDKTIFYEDSGDLTWRKRALLPMSFSGP